MITIPANLLELAGDDPDCRQAWELRLRQAGAESLPPRGTLLLIQQRGGCRIARADWFTAGTRLRALLLDLLPDGARLGLLIREALAPEGGAPPMLTMRVLP